MLQRLLLSVLAVLALAMSGASAQSYPAKPVRIIVPFGPGGPDALARLLGAQLTQQMDQPFLVENNSARTALSARTSSRNRRRTGTR
jgi:tripartite-type tricarboxylate transporter receptor subunit TctC